MGTKMKGLMKGLRYISQIFEEEQKEQEIQIGFPTDVKHVAHIGWDGPSIDSPSWMNEFKTAPLGPAEDPKENPEVKWVSEDSKSSIASDSPKGDTPGLPKSSRRHSSSSAAEKSDSPRKESRRHSRKTHSKDSGEHSVKSSNRQQQTESSTPTATTTGTNESTHPDIPKKSRRKKSKENVAAGTGGGSSSSSSTTKPSRSSKDTGGLVKAKKDEASQNSCGGNIACSRIS